MTKNTHDADVTFIEALAKLLHDNDLTELQVKREYGEDDSLNVRVSRAAPAAATASRTASNTSGALTISQQSPSSRKSSAPASIAALISVSSFAWS